MDSGASGTMRMQALLRSGEGYATKARTKRFGHKRARRRAIEVDDLSEQRLRDTHAALVRTKLSLPWLSGPDLEAHPLVVEAKLRLWQAFQVCHEHGIDATACLSKCNEACR